MQTPKIHIQSFEGPGPEVTAYTVGLVGDFIARGSVHPGFRKRVLRELEDAQVAGHDHAGELLELYDWTITPPWEGGAAVYRKDPWLMEYVHTVGAILGQAAGDCDDLTVLLGASAAAVGHRVRLVTVAWKPGGPDRHIYLVVQPHGDLPWVPVDPTDSELVPLGEHPPGAARLTLWDLEGRRLGSTMRRRDPHHDLGIIPEMLLRHVRAPTSRSSGFQRGGYRALQEWARAHRVIGRGAKKLFPKWYEAGRAMRAGVTREYGEDDDMDMDDDEITYPGMDVEVLSPNQMIGDAKKDMRAAKAAAMRARRARRRPVRDAEARKAAALTLRARKKARLAREHGAEDEEEAEAIKARPRRRRRRGLKRARDRGPTRRDFQRRRKRKFRGTKPTARRLDNVANALELLNEGAFDDEDDGLLGHLEGLSDCDLDGLSDHELSDLGDRAARMARRARRRARRSGRRAARAGRRGTRQEARAARREQRREMKAAAKAERQRRRIAERVRRRAQRQASRQQRRGERRGSREAMRLARMRERLMERRPEAFEPLPEAPMAPPEYYAEEEPYGEEYYEEEPYYEDEYYAADEGDEYYYEDEDDYYYDDDYDDDYYDDDYYDDDDYDESGMYGAGAGDGGLQGLSNALSSLEARRCPPGKECRSST